MSSALQELLETARDGEKRSLPRIEQTTFSLQQEESKAGAELQMLVAEIEAYQDLLAKYPSSLDVINQLLLEAREKSTALYGKLNAVKKVIRLTEQESGELC
jgi:DNA-binding protein H-NS